MSFIILNMNEETTQNVPDGRSFAECVFAKSQHTRLGHKRSEYRL